MIDTKLAPYEIIGLKELLNMEVVSFKKIHAALSMVQDDELETFMKRSLDTKNKSISSIRDFVNSAIDTKKQEGK